MRRIATCPITKNRALATILAVGLFVFLTSATAHGLYALIWSSTPGGGGRGTGGSYAVLGTVGPCAALQATVVDNQFSNDPNCVAVWRLEEGALTADSRSSNTLTNHGAAAQTSSYREGAGCADFERSESDYMSISDASLCSDFPLKSGDTNKKISLCAWIKIESSPAGATQYVAGKYDYTNNKRSLAVYLDDSRHIALTIGYNGGSSYDSHPSTATLALGSWYHVAATFDDSTRAWRLNVWSETSSSVVVDMSGTNAHNINLSDAAWVVGNAHNSASYFDGLIDEVVVFNDVLTPEEIAQIRQGTFGRSPGPLPDPNCVALWRMENGALTVDSQGSNTLTNHGATAQTSSYQEGTGCADFERNESDYMSITDAGLSSKFPLKSGDTNKKISLCAWIRVESSTGATQYIAGKYDYTNNKRSFAVYLDDPRHIGILIGYGDGSSYDMHPSTATLALGSWYHVAATFDDSTRAWRLNVWSKTSSSVVVDMSGTNDHSIHLTDAAWVIGNAHNGAAYFDGLIDKVVVFNDVLTPEEIAQIRQGTFSQSSVPAPDPMQWATAPHATSSSQITMMAAEAQDTHTPVEYYFQNVTVVNGSHDSGWQTARTYTDTGLSPDTLYEYKVKARDSLGHQNQYSVPLSARTEAEPNTAVPEGSAEPVSGALGNDLNLQVDPFTGSVGYTLPIALPPARQGSEPTLALRYGGGGNGWCGVGWSLGMGAIQRDTRRGVPVARDGADFLSHYDDGKGFIVAFGAVNSRLVPVNPATHEYRAETDQAFLKYEYDAADSGHGLWTVTDKSGNKFYFGQVAGEGRTAGAVMVHPRFSSTTPGEEAFLWALAKIQDINGNLTYAYYAQDVNQVYLDEICYNGHTTGPLATTRSVQFELEDRDDKSVSYATGYRVETNKRLKDVRVEVYDLENTPHEWLPFRRYHLDYDRSPSTLRSLLTSVSIYGAEDPSDPNTLAPLPPVTFEYQRKPLEFERDVYGDPVLRDWGTLQQSASVSHSEWHGGGETHFENAALIDINNDGLPDRVLYNATVNPYDPAATPPGNIFRVQLNTGAGFSALQDWGPLDALGHTTSADRNSMSFGVRKPWPADDSYMDFVEVKPSLTDLVDLNGDGFPDRILHRSTVFDASYSPSQGFNYFWVQLGTGLGFERTSPGTGGGLGWVTRQWGPLDLQGFTGTYVCGQSYSEGYFWSSLNCTWDIGDYDITRLSMLDINGDGLPDRLMQGINGQDYFNYGFYPSQAQNYFRVQLNTGSDFERTSGAGGGTEYILLDWGPVDSQGITGNSVSSNAWNAVTATYDGGAFVTLADINGDGLPDRVMRKRTSPYNVFKVQFNTGYGFERTQALNGGGTDFVTRDWGPLTSQGRTEWEWNSLQGDYSHTENNDDAYSATRVDLLDINGDGLPDRVMRKFDAPYSVFKVELNTGTGFTGQMDGNDIDWLGVSSQGTPYELYWASPGFSITDFDDGDPDYSVVEVMMCDINGDGLVDRVMPERTASAGGDPTLFDVFKVQLSQGPFPDLLCKVTGSLGGSVAVTYKPSTQYDNKDHEGISRLGFPVQTASTLTVDDGLGNRSTTTYDYARGCFDGQAREFRGFGKVKVTDPAGAMSVTYFHQGGGYEDPNGGEFADANSVAKKGMPYRVEVYGNDSKLYTVTTNKVEESEITAGTDWYYAYVSQTTKLEYAGVAYEPDSAAYPTTYRAKVRQSVYDVAGKTGNILTSIDLGEVTLGTDPNTIAANVAAHTYTNLDTADDLYIHTSYATITGHPEIVNKIASTKTTSDLAGSDKLKEIVFTYDTLGRVLTEKTWLDKTKDGSANRYTTTSQYNYDTYGNRNQSIDKAGIQTDTTYDTHYQTFPVEKTTGTFVTSTDYDLRSGLPVRTVDPAGMVAESTYDHFFRLTDAMASTEPNNPATLWLTHIDYHLGGITNEVSANYIHQVHEGYEAYTYNDGLGRIVQTRTRAEAGTPGDYRVVHTVYNPSGQIGFQTLPFFANGSAFTKPYSYNVYLKTGAPPDSDDWVANTGITQVDLGALNYDTTYYWDVNLVGATGQVLATSDTWSFTTQSQAEVGWRDPENPFSTLSGLDYARYNGTWKQLPDFDVRIPNVRGTISTFDVNSLPNNVNLAMRYSGYIEIGAGKGGAYTFYASSSDGSRLYIGDTLVVDNDGLKLGGPEERSGSIALKPGKHSITVEYFDYCDTWYYAKSLTVSYKGPDGSGIAKQVIPAGVLCRDNPNAPISPAPYHQEPSVGLTPRLTWEGCLPGADWDDSFAGVHTEYDAMGRTWKVTPAGDEEGSPTGPSYVVYSDANDPWVQVSTDAEGKVTKKYFDAAGRVIQLVEETADVNVVTTYEYDRLGRLITTTDHAGNEFQAEYDSLDRKIRSIDPDMGTWTYAYDDAGRMTEQVDSRGSKVAFSYTDELGRVTEKRVYASGNPTPVETITYTYDQSDDPEYTVHKGQVYKVTDGQGWTKTGYDSQGRAIKATRYLSATGKSYTTQTAYDPADRVIQVTYPDNKAVIAYSYDEVSHLTKVESLWGTGADEVFYQASGFNEMHQETTVSFGNGRSTQYQYYEHTRRLKHVLTTGGSTIQDVNYTYDKASNIASVTDNPHTGAQSCGLSNIVYDDLYRLTSLYSTAEGKTLTYEYTALGNINKNGEMGTGAYTYSPTQPHAVTAANGSSYSYDAAGNMTARNRYGQPGQTLTYDEQNRLTQVAIGGGSTVQFGYSAGGGRLWKKVDGQVTQVWIGSLYEEKNGKTLCHVYAGDRLVASFEPSGGFACLVEHHPYFAALWHFGDKTFCAFFGGGRAPLSGMGLAILAGLGCGLYYSRKRLWLVYGLSSPSASAAFYQRNPWRQVIVTALAGAVLVTSIPTPAYAGTPVYDPVFYYYHPDNLGSSQLMTDRDGDVVQQYGYSPFGREDYKNNTLAFSVSDRYTGQTLDEETGLYYYGARYYDPELARFIQADSTIPDPEFSQALNRYAYVYNNPLKFTDPTGQDPITLAILIATAIKAAVVSAVISAGIAAATGGDVGKALLSGFIGGFCGGIGGMFGVVGGFVGSVAGGALGALAVGGNPGLGALYAGVGFAVQSCLGFSPEPSTGDVPAGQYLQELAVSTASGAMCGGVTAELMGGKFKDGAISAAASAAASYVVSVAIESAERAKENEAVMNGAKEFWNAPGIDEYGYWLLTNDRTGAYYAAKEIKGDPEHVDPQKARDAAIAEVRPLPDDYTAVTFVHRHGAAEGTFLRGMAKGFLKAGNPDRFSVNDMNWSKNSGYDIYLISKPSGEVRWYNYRVHGGNDRGTLAGNMNKR
jgi:RHS repeat-associated protein